MKEVILAKSAGFCFGVKRAVETVYQQIETGNAPIYTYGPIIHNEEVVADLERRGVRVLDKEHPAAQKGTVVIRSHGISKSEYEWLKAQGHTCVDATCPFVKKIHRIVEEESKKGSHIVIIGTATHPEVQGIRGWVQSSATVIENEEEARDFALPYKRGSKGKSIFPLQDTKIAPAFLESCNKIYPPIRILLHILFAGAGENPALKSM